MQRWNAVKVIALWFRELHVVVPLQLRMATLKWFVLNWSSLFFFNGNSMEDGDSREIHSYAATVQSVAGAIQVFNYVFLDSSNFFLVPRNGWMNYLMGGRINVNSSFRSYTMFFESNKRFFSFFFSLWIEVREPHLMKCILHTSTWTVVQ